MAEAHWGLSVLGFGLGGVAVLCAWNGIFQEALGDSSLMTLGDAVDAPPAWLDDGMGFEYEVRADTPGRASLRFGDGTIWLVVPERVAGREGSKLLSYIPVRVSIQNESYSPLAMDVHGDVLYSLRATFLTSDSQPQRLSGHTTSASSVRTRTVAGPGEFTDPHMVLVARDGKTVELGRRAAGGEPLRGGERRVEDHRIHWPTSTISEFWSGWVRVGLVLPWLDPELELFVHVHIE